MTRPRRRGEGKVYQRRDHAGRLVWYVRWYEHGDRHESVAKTLGKPPEKVTQKDAERLLAQRLKEKWLREQRPGLIGDARPSRMTVAELLDGYDQHLAVKGIKSYGRMHNEIQAVKAWLGDEPVARLTKKARLTELVQEYQQVERVVKGQPRRYAPGTVQMRLSILHAAMAYGHEALGLPPVPKFPELSVRNARQVMIAPEELEQILLQLRLADPADDVVRFGLFTGWRISEALQLEWSRVGREPWSVRLDDSKSGRPRKRQAEPELQGLLEQRWAQRAIGCPFVFHRHGGRVSYGWFNKAWRRACARAGLSDRRFHDLRRMAYAELAAAGVDLFEAMALVGHESLSVAKRYNIVDPQRQADALRKLTVHRARQKNPRNTRAAGGPEEAGSPS